MRSLVVGWGLLATGCTPVMLQQQAQSAPPQDVDRARDLLLQPDGKLVVAGARQTASGTSFLLIRYLPDGSLDPGFGTGGAVTTSFGTRSQQARAIALQPDGGLVATGDVSGGAVGLVRYASDGSLDSAFGQDGQTIVRFPTLSTPNALALTADGKLIVTGKLFQVGGFIIRLDPQGAIDESFGEQGRVSIRYQGARGATAVALQADGQLIVAVDRPALLRYNADGTLDQSFGEGGWAPGSAATQSVLRQPEGRLLTIGSIEVKAAGLVSPPVDGFVMARYQPDGQLDPTFGSGGTVVTAFDRTAEPWAVAIQSNGRLVVAGSIWEGRPGRGVAEPSELVLVRYLHDGAVDPDFGTNGVARLRFGSGQNVAYALTIQPDGKLVTAADVGAEIRVIRFRQDGSLDQVFQPPER
jgi:uncharacterized delta-60 repeat protein